MKTRKYTKRIIGFCLPLLILLCFIFFNTLYILLNEEEIEEKLDNTIKKFSKSNTNENICSKANTCLNCLFPTFNIKSPINVSLPSTECFWCASINICMPYRNKEACDDIEDVSCPAVLHSIIPNNFRVLHVGIRKGGPEALIQLHLALNHWGFHTTLDTRFKEKGGFIVPFFREMYKSELNKAPPLRWFKNYETWHNSAVEGDVLIATETWPCIKRKENYFLNKGIRQMQWHLTVWPRRDRSHCTIIGHTNYITMTYMNQSKFTLLYPYVSPHIVKLAQSRSSWRDFKKRGKKQIPLILFDGDVDLQNSDFKSINGDIWDVKKATGFTPENLYALYSEAIAGIDLKLPGAERFIFEAVLFDVCVIVDDSLVGGCKEDIPIPDIFRVPSGNLYALNSAIDNCVKNYDNVISQFDKIKNFTLKQKITFERQVRRYFSNSIHIISIVCSNEESEKYLLRFILNILIYIPFATIEIRLADNVFGLNEKHYNYLLEQSWLSAVRFVKINSKETLKVCQINNNDNLKMYENSTIKLLQSILLSNNNSIFSNEKRSLLTIFAPINIIILNENIVHYITSQFTLLLQRRTLIKNEFPIFIIESNVTEGLNVQLLALWTSNISSFTCESMTTNDILPLLNEICLKYEKQEKYNFIIKESITNKKMGIVIHDDQDHSIPLARVVLKDFNDIFIRNAWEFMCLHNLWKDLIGGC